MKIGVVGLGLIGGSIFKALKKNHDVIAVSTSVREVGISNDYNSLIACELIFVCTPMSVTLDVLDKLNLILNDNTIVTDVCSLKDFVTKKKYNFKFIPSHPMAGTEHSGWNNSFPELFQGAKWAITPIDDETVSEQKVLENIIKELGATPIITNPKEHDNAVALISHMPMLVAQALCKNIENNELAQILAASGFRDTTRLALSNTQMASDMINMNNKNIKNALETLNNCISDLLIEDYSSKIEKIKEFRKNLY